MYEKLICVTALMGAGFAVAQTVPETAYPVKPLRMIVPNSPGSATDTVARIIALRLAPRLGQPVLVENRGGAGGMIGSDIVAKAAPDGYTIGLVSGTHTVNPSLYAKMPFDPVKDFAPVTMLATAPFVLMVHPALPAKSLKELIDLAKARPGKIHFASAGTGVSTHLAGELLKSMAKIDIVHVPYRGAGPALVDVIGGQVEMTFNNIVSSIPHIKSGRLRALAVTGMKRSPVLPDLPTIDEPGGLKGYEASVWYGVVAPARTPVAIVSRLSTELNRVLNNPQVRERLNADGATIVGGTPEQFGLVIREDVVRWAKVVKQANIRLDKLE